MTIRDKLPALSGRGLAGMPAFSSFRNDMDRLFEDFFGTFDVQNGFGKSGEFLPSLDVQRDGDRFKVSLELAGVDPDDIDVSVEDQVLTVSGEKKSSTEKIDGEMSRRESHYGSFSRSVRLPFPIPEDGVEAKLEKGILSIFVPAPAELKPAGRKIAIQH